MPTEPLPDLLTAWTACGWLRPLDRAFARFLKTLRPDADDAVMLAAALTSHQLGRGHICLDLAALLRAPDAALGLPPEGDPAATPARRPSLVLKGREQDAWERQLLASGLVDAGEGDAPLVLSAGRLYLRRYWHYTQLVARSLSERLGQALPAPADLARRLDQVFAHLRSPEEQNKTEVHWQSVAAAMAVKSAFCIISGGPGTGKTTTVVQLLGLLQGMALEQGRKLRIGLAAPTGKAAARLTESIGRALDRLPQPLREALPLKVATLHRLLGSRPDTRHFVHHAQNPLHLDLLVVDEASMIDLEIMAALLAALPLKARLILLGDKDQLASVEAGSVLGDLCRGAERPGYRPDTLAWLQTHSGYDLSACAGPGARLEQHIAVLRKSHRFGEHSGIGALARAVNTGNPEAVAAVWDRQAPDIARLTLHTPMDASFEALVLDGHGGAFLTCGPGDGPVGCRAYLQLIHEGPAGSDTEEDWMRRILSMRGRFQLLTPLRRGPWGLEGLNRRAAAILNKAGLIPAVEGWYPGRPVMVTRNDPNLGLMNGDTGLVLPARTAGDRAPSALRAVFAMPDGSLKAVLPSRLGDVETAFAMTVHKAQGSEFDHTVLILPDAPSPVVTRELVYTAVTRSRRWFTLASARMDLLGDAVRQRIQRASGLGELLD